jgi:hypothetical protein
MASENVMTKLQKALREMFVIGVVLAIPLYIYDHDYNVLTIFIALLFGLLWSPVVWGIYRLGRFMILPRRETSF